MYENPLKYSSYIFIIVGLKYWGMTQINLKSQTKPLEMLMFSTTKKRFANIH